METKLISFENKLFFGEEGEKEIAISLINNGVALMPMYQFTKENAPYLLDKINKSGVKSLTTDELDFLNNQ